jgi:hypothetical protein
MMERIRQMVFGKSGAQKPDNKSLAKGAPLVGQSASPRVPADYGKDLENLLGANQQARDLTSIVLDYVGPVVNSESVPVTELQSRGLKPMNLSQLYGLNLGCLVRIAPPKKLLSRHDDAQAYPAVVCVSLLSGNQSLLSFHLTQEKVEDIHTDPVGGGHGSVWSMDGGAAHGVRVFFDPEQGQVGKMLSDAELQQLPRGTHLIVGGKFSVEFFTLVHVEKNRRVTLHTCDESSSKSLRTYFGLKHYDKKPSDDPDFPGGSLITFSLSENESVGIWRDPRVLDSRRLVSRSRPEEASETAGASIESGNLSSSSSSNVSSNLMPRVDTKSSMTPFPYEATPHKQLDLYNLAPGARIVLTPRFGLNREPEEVTYLGLDADVPNHFRIEVSKDSALKTDDKFPLVAPADFDQELPRQNTSIDSSSSASISASMSSSDLMSSTRSAQPGALRANDIASLTPSTQLFLRFPYQGRTFSYPAAFMGAKVDPETGDLRVTVQSAYVGPAKSGPFTPADGGQYALLEARPGWAGPGSGVQPRQQPFYQWTFKLPKNYVPGSGGSIVLKPAQKKENDNKARTGGIGVPGDTNNPMPRDRQNEEPSLPSLVTQSSSSSSSDVLSSSAEAALRSLDANTRN